MTIKAVAEAFLRSKDRMARYDRWDDFYWSYNETSTRYILIDPVLQALGWDIYDMRQCAVEWPMPFDRPIGRAEYVLGNSRNENAIVIEAKSIKVSIGGRPSGFENKLAGYTKGMKAGVAVLTNGLIWHLYELDSRRGAFKNKWVATVDIREDHEDFAKPARILHGRLNKRKWW
jgi:hypothetical protein